MSSSPKTPHHTTLPITTHHCRFCTNLVLASTRKIESLPRRRSSDAQILPLRMNPLFDNPEKPDTSAMEEQGEGEGAKGAGNAVKHYTILLSTTIRDRKPSILRCKDGFEKRYLFRCGRCRLVMGYFLDEVHFPEKGGLLSESEEGKEVGEDRAVYLLPGALTETEIMSDEEKLQAVDREWSAWFRD
ncbi:hypothetical protein BJX68DRAFT_239882 [Aspergillus pseudodeflectus]|uniref:STEEP1 domain-containing protein n=1 Tax=Aspergillus pseudodeflectus TaxID=176178 RepID=A0ABR4K4R4_9EURO